MLLFMRALLIVFSTFSGFFIVFQVTGNINLSYVGLISGFLIALCAILFEERVRRTPFSIVLGGAVGLITGLILANLIVYPISKFIQGSQYLQPLAYLCANFIIGYLGLSIGMKKGEDIKGLKHLGPITRLWGAAVEGEKPEEPAKEQPGKMLMDTSVIIDGRIVDLCKTGFIEGPIVVPNFILLELQVIADSSEPTRRVRGKRGLDILKTLQQEDSVEIEITDENMPDVKAVDAKLVALGKKLSCKILTNDANLNKVADLQGVGVININVLANALKPVVLPGEVMQLLVAKEGKEQGQGVGYLDDGTMVVIDNAKEHVGKQVGISVTSVLQTTGGRMIFAKVKEYGKSPVYLHTSN